MTELNNPEELGAIFNEYGINNLVISSLLPLVSYEDSIS